MANRIAAIIAAVVLGMVGIPGASLVAHARTAQGQQGPVMVIIDDSGSMAESLGSQTKIDAAKAAVGQLAAQAPPGGQIGLMTYGSHTTSADSDKTPSCQDISVLMPVGPVDAGAMNAAAGQLQPGGWTPIAMALQQAGTHLTGSGHATIVLVSDGAESCGGQSCQAAQQLENHGIDVRVDTVGLGVDDTGRDQLNCIAQATGGSYTELSDAGRLPAILPHLVAQAIRNYQPSGTLVHGTTDPGSAPMIGTGQYVDTVGPRDTKYYAVTIPAGDTLYASAVLGPYGLDLPTGVGYSDDDDNPTLALKDAQGNGCTDNGNEVGGAGAIGDLSVPAISWDGMSHRAHRDSCNQPGRYLLSIKRNQGDSDWSGSPEAMELLIGLEPAVSDQGPAPAPAVASFTAPTGNPSPVTGATSFAGAATLPGTGRYADTLAVGDNVIYRVKLGWGQSLSYRVDIPAMPELSGPDYDANIDTMVYSPWRAHANGTDVAWNGAGGPETLGPVSTYPVQWRNRLADKDTQRTAALAGWYYISVKIGGDYESPAKAATHAVPITLDVDVSGTSRLGPTYAGQPANQPDANPFGTTFSRVRPVSHPSAQPAKHASDSALAAGAAGVGIFAILVGLGVGAWLVTRNRRAR